MVGGSRNRREQAKLQRTGEIRTIANSQALQKKKVNMGGVDQEPSRSRVSVRCSASCLAHKLERSPQEGRRPSGNVGGPQDYIGEAAKARVELKVFL